MLFASVTAATVVIISTVTVAATVTIVMTVTIAALVTISFPMPGARGCDDRADYAENLGSITLLFVVLRRSLISGILMSCLAMLASTLAAVRALATIRALAMTMSLSLPLLAEATLLCCHRAGGQNSTCQTETYA